MTYPGTGVTFSHFDSAVNIKGFQYDLSTAPTTARALTGVTSSDYVLFVGGHRFYSAAGAQPKLSLQTIAFSLGTALIKFSNGVSNSVVMGFWVDRNA